MRSKHLTAAGGLGFALGAGAAFLGCSLTGSTLSTGGPLDLFVTTATLTVGAGAWGVGRWVAERSAAEAGRRWTMLEEVGEEIAWECDADGRFTYASAQSLAVLGYLPEQVRSLTLFDILHPEEHADAARLLATGAGWRRRPFRCMASDGSPVWLRSNAVATLDGDGRPDGLRGSSQALDSAPLDALTARATSEAVLRVLQSDAVRTAFQPIMSLRDERVVGVEALSRFSLPGDHRSPEDWFTGAAGVGLGTDLELHTLMLALDAARALPGHLYVSVNLSPETLMCPGVSGALARSPIHPARIVLEITEHSSVEDYNDLARALRPLREAGMRIAVDDAGAGYATFRHILALSPDVIKLDRTLIAGIDRDPARRALAAAVVSFAGETRTSVVAEGLETAAEFRTVLRLGVDSGQGYLLGRPTVLPEEWLSWQAPELPTGATAAASAVGP
ncbi:MAG: sensor domain-containing phosphodiesterase [Blastococcus sp.]